MDAAELELVRKSFEAAMPALTGDTVAALDELGWAELARAEPVVAVAELFEAQGRLLYATAALDVVVAGAAGLVLRPGVAVLHPVPGRDGPPGVLTAGGRVTCSGLVLAGTPSGAGPAAELAVPFLTGAGTVAAATLRTGDATLQPVGGLDPTMRLVAVTGVADAGSTASSEPPPDWPTVVRAARRALAHELTALGQRMLDEAVRHVTDRHQFGRPIAAFQTVRHRLTDVYVAIAAARGALGAAWDGDDPMMADAAKVLAGRAAALAGRHCLQVCGAVGFTDEHLIPAALRRAGVVDALYGGADGLRAQLGRTLLEHRRLPG